MQAALNALQCCSMILIVGAGTLLMINLYRFPQKPVKGMVVGMYLTGSLGWATYAILTEHYFLVASASSNIAVYSLSLFKIFKQRKKHLSLESLEKSQKIKCSDSEGSLPSLPALPK